MPYYGFFKSSCDVNYKFAAYHNKNLTRPLAKSSVASPQVEHPRSALCCVTANLSGKNERHIKNTEGAGLLGQDHKVFDSLTKFRSRKYDFSPNVHYQLRGTPDTLAPSYTEGVASNLI
jgi:hypothetical protein